MLAAFLESAKYGLNRGTARVLFEAVTRLPKHVTQRGGHRDKDGTLSD
jgi:hypothetical protein